MPSVTKVSVVGGGRLGGGKSRINNASGASRMFSTFTSGTGGAGGVPKVIVNGMNLTPQSLIKGSGGRETMVVDKEQHSSTPKKASISQAQQPASTKKEKEPKSRAADKNAGEEDGSEIYESFTLSETPTMELLRINGSAVATDFRDFDQYQREKMVYEKALLSRAGSDKYVERHTQTCNWAHKNKEVMAAAPAMKDAECGVHTWEIFDEQAQRADAGVGEDNLYGDMGGKVEASISLSSVQKHSDEMVAVTLASPGCLLDMEHIVAPPPLPLHGGNHGQGQKGGRRGSVKSKQNTASSQAAGQKGQHQPSDNQAQGDANEAAASGGDVQAAAKAVLAQQLSRQIIQSPELLHSLELVERLLFQNQMHAKQLEYRDYPSVEETIGASEPRPSATFDESPSEPYESISSNAREDQRAGSAGLEKLWTHSFPLQDAAHMARTITAMCFHHVNTDMLAVGYGDMQYSAGFLNKGHVLFWSVRNPLYPELVIDTQSSVTSLDFSERHPNLLAVGMYDGTIAIYDTARTAPSTPVVESSTSAGKHTDPVWQVKWVNKGVERGESLVSVSTDGRVVEWSMKKGFSYSPLMVLRRVGSTEGVISRQASGLSIDFPQGDGATYFVGTEDGLIHKCSTSYNEQYLETYTGHSGPIYSIKCSPFWDQALLSCSADWTVRLWDQRQTCSLHVFHSVDLAAGVNDIAWSPTSSTIFASVAGDGRIELWDLTVSTLDPVVRVKVTEDPPEPEEPPEPQEEEDEYGLIPKESNKESVASSGSRAPGSTVIGTEEEAVLAPVELTCVVFATNTPVLAVGNVKGRVDVYKIVGMEVNPNLAPSEQIERLRQAIELEDVLK